MNCTQAQRELLLAGSGELSREAQARLDGHVAACPACRALADEWQALARAAAEALPAVEPSPAVLGRIRDAAAERATPRTLAFPAWGIPVRVLAAAAALFVAVGVLWFVSTENRAARARHMNTLLAALCEDNGVEAGEVVGARDEMRTLARQLLTLQGLTEETIDDAGATTTDEEPWATAPLSHSTAALPATGCV
jgi:anti-sigma factor RsiW